MSRSSPRIDGPHADEKLERLLDVERRLEQRVRDAEREARERVDEARAASDKAAADGRAQLEATAREEERADLERHAREVERIDASSVARVRALAELSDAYVDRLARGALARLAADGGEEAPP